MNNSGINGETPMVSILCITYNQKKYIRECLDSLVSQQTDFSFEILVHDDASRDGTADIIAEYAERYTDKVFPIFQSENKYSQGNNILYECLPHIRGKWVAFCDGDDFWTDVDKLQKQMNAVRTSRCLVSVHQTQFVSEDATQLLSVMPRPSSFSSGIISSSTFCNAMLRAYCFHTTSYFFASDLLRRYCEEAPAFARTYLRLGIGDLPLALYIALHTDVVYLAQICSAHRHFADGSWSVSVTRESVWQLLRSCCITIKANFQFDKCGYPFT